MPTVVVPVPYNRRWVPPEIPTKPFMLSGVVIGGTTKPDLPVATSTRRERYFLSKEGKRYVR